MMQISNLGELIDRPVHAHQSVSDASTNHNRGELPQFSDATERSRLRRTRECEVQKLSTREI